MKDADVARLAGVKPSTFSDWKSGRSDPKIDKLISISRALNVSLDYLATGSDFKQEPLSPSERELISLFRKLNATGKSAALGHLSDLAEISKYTQEKTISKAG